MDDERQEENYEDENSEGSGNQQNPVDDDESLVERIKNGDKSACDELYKKYYEKFYIHAYLNYFNNDYWASLCATDTLIKIFEKIKTFDGRSKFVTWAYRILKNECINKKKSKEYRNWLKTVSIDPKPMPGEDEKKTQYPGKKPPDGELSEMMERAISMLPEKYRILIVMYHFENYSYNEISEILEMKLNTVKGRLNRARKKLGKILKELGIDELLED